MTEDDKDNNNNSSNNNSSDNNNSKILFSISLQWKDKLPIEQDFCFPFMIILLSKEKKNCSNEIWMRKTIYIELKELPLKIIERKNERNVGESCKEKTQ